MRSSDYLLGVLRPMSFVRAMFVGHGVYSVVPQAAVAARRTAWRVDLVQVSVLLDEAAAWTSEDDDQSNQQTCSLCCPCRS